MSALAISAAIEHFGAIAPLLVVPRTDNEYEALVSALDDVLDAGGANEDHPLAVLAERMGDLVAGYEAHHVPEAGGNGVDALHFLMTQHGLTQCALPEVGSQGVVSEVLAGKRALNLRQIRALSQRFGVSAQVFV